MRFPMQVAVNDRLLAAWCGRLPAEPLTRDTSRADAGADHEVALSIDLDLHLLEDEGRQRPAAERQDLHLDRHVPGTESNPGPQLAAAEVVPLLDESRRVREPADRLPIHLDVPGHGIGGPREALHLVARPDAGEPVDDADTLEQRNRSAAKADQAVAQVGRD